MKNLIKKIYFKLPLPTKIKNRIYFKLKNSLEERQKKDYKLDADINKNVDLISYIKYILSIPNRKNDGYKAFVANKEIKSDIHYIAYYLTQYHPNKYNDEWWGKGVTEWNNVSKAVPQFNGHEQPRLPGELGYYDLRIKDNMKRQIELAKNYGIDSFCFYYYWFDGKRLLEEPLNMFLENKDLDINFCVSWANENWTRRFSGTNTDVLMAMKDTEESNVNFIFDILEVLKDFRYLRIDNKPILLVYRPSNIVNAEKVLLQWRKIVKEKINCDLYIVATQEKGDTTDWIKYGFDAETEFQPKSVLPHLDIINGKCNLIRTDFKGCIYDYKDLIDNRRYIIKRNLKRKVYPAVMPMWDNTARRDKNAVIFKGSSPEYYGKWLDDVINLVRDNKTLDNHFIFINAWNEWGEGAYLEPDNMWGYAYLQETYDSKLRNNRNEIIDY